MINASYKPANQQVTATTVRNDRQGQSSPILPGSVTIG